MHITKPNWVVVLVAVIFTSGASAQVWTVTSAPITNWSCLAASADGTKLVAAAKPSPIYLSTDGGATWTPTASPTNNWTSLSCSADASTILGTDGTTSQLSTDSGVTWTNVLSTGGSVTCSGDGMVLANIAGNTRVNYSTDRGQTTHSFFANGSKGANGAWITISADGSRLVGIETIIGAYNLFNVTNFLNVTSVGGGNGTYVRVATSANGYTWAAVKTSASDAVNGVFCTTNAGATSFSVSIPSNSWTSVTVSADGSHMAASASQSFGGGGLIYTSMDSGTTWAPSDAPATNWSVIASSADGNKLVAAVNGGPIYIRQNTPTPLLNTTCPDSSNVVVSWIVPSASFVLQQNTDLTTTNWAEVVTPPLLNYSNLNYEVTVPAAPGAVFYRLSLLP